MLEAAQAEAEDAALPSSRRRVERRRRERRVAHEQTANVIAQQQQQSIQANDTTTIGFFWHITDGHINEFMPPNANPCDYCRSSYDSTSDAAIACDKPPPGIFGHVDCDASVALWREALRLMKRIAPSPDFVLSGGDWIGKVPSANQGASVVRSAAVIIATMLHKTFPGTPMLHTIGNHDTHPYYSTEPAWSDWEAAWRADPQLGDAFVAQQFPGVSLAEWRGGGYYSRILWQAPAESVEAASSSSSSPAVHGIAINTNDLALTGGREQLRWLERTLQAIRDKGERAVLLGHIPPGPSHFEFDSICSKGHYYNTAGGSCWRPAARRRFVELLTRYADVVPASFFGHHHTDSVRVLDDGSGGGLGGGHVSYLAAALTPRSPPHDPSVRLYSYSRLTGQPLDYREFRLDLKKANAWGLARWDEAASALRKLPLNLTSLQPSEWSRALRGVLAADHRPTSTVELSAADPFFRWVSAERCAREAYVESGAESVPPLRKCKLAHVCAALHVDDGPYAECIGMPLQ